ncbi:venom serine carboxypeptidase-like [Leguminivora glycinivorella]|uniref:venom serine carboxypeptidase-like n=1 Tax=Leguminivora glycinivorella TaxID=1035111 RepID=UPI0020103D53|nr:venom serine carboxypeptidase-like [Leguminivora glycinivorella]
MSSLLLILLSWQAILSYGHPQHTGVRKVKTGEDPGEPLFLTPLIEKGDIKKARHLARVNLNDSLPIESYTGFFTVNKAHDSNQFFWYFPSMFPDKDQAPVLVWLQGGPGGSSLFGLFCENGPIAEENGQFVPRQYHWALNHHVIYIDNPVGSGFSFTNDTKGYCTDETQVGEQLYSTITQFFQLFPELQKNDFFITGESYAGKYVPAFAHTIHKKNSNAKTKINLKGLIIGGAYINPESQNKFRLVSDDNSNYIKLGKCDPDQEGGDTFIPVLTENEIRKAIHVGALPYSEFNNTVYNYLLADIPRSMAPWLSELLDHYSVTLYGGEDDHTVPYAGIVDFLRNHFNFTGADEYKSTKRYSWRVNGELAGCVRSARLLKDIFVLKATHYVPADQPERAWDMITRLTYGKGFDKKEICPVEQASAFSLS